MTATVIATLTIAGTAAAHTYPTGDALRRIVQRTDPCLAQIIERETGGTWDPTIDFGFGHGNVNESYGLGQAQPGWKMAPYGKEWRTSPWVQLAWMRSYARERYGGSCNAWAYWQRHRWW